MDCSDARQFLSAFCDDELAADQRGALADHLAVCSECARVLQEFRSLSAIAKELTHPEPPHQLWEKIQAQQDSSDGRCESSEPARSPWWGGRFLPWGVAIAAVLLVAIGWVGYRQRRMDHDHHQFTAVFSQFLQEFQQDPQAAQQSLVARYSGRPVDPKATDQLLGYIPVVASGLPEGYSLTSAHVMKMPCCTCVECLCQRNDGTALAIFEHNDKEQSWFDGRPSRDTVCHGKSCTVIDLEDDLAAVWKQGPRYLTLIGARSQTEINQLVGWFDERRMHVSDDD